MPSTPTPSPTARQSSLFRLLNTPSPDRHRLARGAGFFPKLQLPKIIPREAPTDLRGKLTMQAYQLFVHMSHQLAVLRDDGVCRDDKRTQAAHFAALWKQRKEGAKNQTRAKFANYRECATAWYEELGTGLDQATTERPARITQPNFFGSSPSTQKTRQTEVSCEQPGCCHGYTKCEHAIKVACKILVDGGHIVSAECLELHFQTHHEEFTRQQCRALHTVSDTLEGVSCRASSWTAGRRRRRTTTLSKSVDLLPRIVSAMLGFIVFAPSEVPSVGTPLEGYIQEPVDGATDLVKSWLNAK